MTTAPISQMYTASAIRFRDPFVPKDIPPSSAIAPSYDRPVNAWRSGAGHHDLTRALTPPPEMNGLQGQVKPSHYAQERVHRYNGITQDQQYSRPAPVQNPAHDIFNTDFGRSAAPAPVLPGRISPPRAESRRGTIDLSNDAQTQRRASQANPIANNFQIPRSVNDSGGSLSELAAQITCLFWFESSDLLQQIESSPNPLQPTRPLLPDARPTTGFRKWVTTILSTTCVAQNVVLLALLFIHRLKKLNPSVNGKPGSEYRLLTVALMLGNKFLDDNTYTNKTWAEVSGITVSEVHIMEVEFLSNMKYCLFTSEQDWARWQTLLGKFASFFDRASRPQPAQLPAPVLPPTSSVHLPINLPSPPTSNQASPPYSAEQVSQVMGYGNASQLGPTPAPSPLNNMTEAGAGPSPPRVRKRSCYEDAPIEPMSKRLANGLPTHTSPQRFPPTAVQADQLHSIPRLPLPNLPIPHAQASLAGFPQPMKTGQQLPPLSIPARAMAMAYPHNAHGQLPSAMASNASIPQQHLQGQSRNQSPFVGSGPASPTPLPHSATSVNPPAQISPSYFLRQRNSPYRPVHHVSTLLIPPPSGAIQQRPQNVELAQMFYQPLGKPMQHRQNGRLPYVGQNLWVDGNQPHEMTPVHQWPGFIHAPPNH